MAQDLPEADESQVVELYDFLYRDQNRLASYYAQVFTGQLSQMEETHQDVSGHQTSGKGGIHFVEGAYQFQKNMTTGVKRTIDPHDVNTIGILSYLRDNGMVSEDVSEAGNGDLILTRGTLMLMDGVTNKDFLVIAISANASLNTPQKYLSKNSPEKAAYDHQALLGKLVKDWVSSARLPSGFVLSQEGGGLLCGTLHDEGMAEPIHSYYFKQGAKGLNDVFIIGIKEESATDFPFLPQGESVFDASAELVKAMETLVFPTDGVRVTPLVMFRILNRVKSSRPALSASNKT